MGIVPQAVVNRRLKRRVQRAMRHSLLHMTWVWSWRWHGNKVSSKVWRVVCACTVGTAKACVLPVSDVRLPLRSLLLLLLLYWGWSWS